MLKFSALLLRIFNFATFNPFWQLHKSNHYGFYSIGEIGEIPYFLGDSCYNDVESMITSSEEDKHSKDFETEFVLSAVNQKSQNQSGVQAFSYSIKVKCKHDGNV
jgi:hypothetical protein